MAVYGQSVKSITGNIIFDINNDGVSDAKLSSNGFAIGENVAPSANLHLQGNGIITGELVVGGTAGNSMLEVQGTVGYSVQTVSDNITLGGNSHILADSSTGDLTLTLPNAGSVMGRFYIIKKTSTSNQVTLNGGGGNIDSSSAHVFSSGNSSFMKVVSNGSQWYILSQSSEGLAAPVSAVITPVSATASSEYNATNGDADNVLGPGFTELDSISTSTHGSGGWGTSTHWFSTAADKANPNIDFDLGGTYTITDAHIWNYNGNPAGDLNWGVKDFTIVLSQDSTFGDGDDTSFSFTGMAKGNGLTSYTGEHFSLTPTSGITHIRIQVDTEWGSSFTGLSEVRFSGY